MKKYGCLFLLFSIIQVGKGQNFISYKITKEHTANYLLLQLEQIQKTVHQLVLDDQILPYPTPSLQNPFDESIVASLGGTSETIQYAPDVKDPYYYRDTLIITPFTYDKVVGWQFKKKNAAAPYLVSNIQSLGFYYQSDDTTQKPLYFMDFNQFTKPLNAEQLLVINLILEELNSNNTLTILGQTNWIRMAAHFFEQLNKVFIQNAEANSEKCFEDKLLTKPIHSNDWKTILNFNFVPKTNSVNGSPKKFVPSDIDFIAVNEKSLRKDSLTYLSTQSFGIGHYYALTGVDNLERMLFWVSINDANLLLEEKYKLLLNNLIYSQRLYLMDGNKNYMSDYLLNKLKE